MKELKKRNRVWVKQSLLTALFLCLFLFWFSAGYTAEITLLWDKNTETDIEGYRVYSGISSKTYATNPICQVDSNWNSCTVIVPLDGKTRYYAVKAYNTEGLESAFSNEVSYKPLLFRISH
jgi:fibronectin type 3 domain-containing protein